MYVPLCKLNENSSSNISKFSSIFNVEMCCVYIENAATLDMDWQTVHTENMNILNRDLFGVDGAPKSQISNYANTIAKMLW